MQPLYPEVNYQNWGGFVPDVVHYSSEITDKGSMSLARAAYEADYMINMALMKRHSEPTDKWRDWSSFRGMGTYNCIVDLMAHERIGGNTLVYIVDAMYVNPKHNGHAVRFKRAPFNNGWTSSFLASNDQVAIESVVLDFIYSELPLPANADNFLHEAANIGNPPSGIAYAGKKLVSLGVHEHWNNPEQRMYSRNLGTGKGIELYRVPLDENRAAIEYFYADGTTLHYKVSNADEVRLNNMKLDNTEGHLCVGVDKTTDYRLEAIKYDKVVATQRLVLRNLQPIITCQTKEMLLNGSATINEDGSVEFKGEKGSSNGFIAWKAEIPYTGKYYLENIGYLATTGNKRGNFIFPIDLEKGVNELRLEHPGRRSNKLYTITIAKEIN